MCTLLSLQLTEKKESFVSMVKKCAIDNENIK